MMRILQQSQRSSNHWKKKSYKKLHLIISSIEVIASQKVKKCFTLQLNDVTVNYI